jgi:cell division septation protein DedD
VSGRQGAEAAGIGWLATLGGAGLLLAFGFGIGLVAGSALEEPDLVAKHLAGEATELPLPEATAKPPPAPAAAPAPQAAPEAPAPGPEAARTAEAPSDFDAGEGSEPRAAVPEAVGTPNAPPRAEAPPPPKPPAPAPAAPSVAARTPTPGPSGFAVQVGAFGDRKAADALVASLRAERLRAYVAEGGAGESARFRVRVGPYATRQQASDEAARLQKRRRLPTWVLAEGGP